MPAPARKAIRKEPCGKNARSRSRPRVSMLYDRLSVIGQSSETGASKPVREARARVVARGALGERAARGVAVQPSRLQIADHDPFPAEIDAPEQSAGRKQRAASRRIRGQAG